MALDPVLLARAAGLEPDPWQADVLRARATQTLLLCSRQSGKSTTTAVLAVDEALHRAPALVLVLAPALRQSQELFRKIKHVLAAVAGPDALSALVAAETALSLELVTGSRIVCLPGKEATIRGFSAVALLVVDEAARVADDLYAAIRPMLAVSRGRIIALSTPWGKRGWFHAEWTQGGPAWHRVQVTAHDCPRIDPAWLEQERQTTPTHVFASEYLCQFVDTEDQVFSYEAVMAAISQDVAPLFGSAA